MDLDLENHHLLRPLLTPSITTAAVAPPPDSHSLNSNIVLRLSLVLFIGVVSIWANHEASKGFAVTIVNESADTIAGKRFQLFYVSNDEATRAVIKASRLVEDFLYPPNWNLQAKKTVKAVILKLVNRTLPESVIVDTGKENEFVINLSASVMEGENFENAVVSAVRRGVARMWLWDGQGHAPRNLIDGIVDYITGVYGGSSAVGAEMPVITAACWKKEDPRVVAQLLHYCESRRPGFVGRLNESMKDGWNPATFGYSAEGICGSCVGQCTTLPAQRTPIHAHAIHNMGQNDYFTPVLGSVPVFNIEIK